MLRRNYKKKNCTKKKKINKSDFFTKPLYRLDSDTIIVASPRNIGYSCKNYILEEAKSLGVLHPLISHINCFTSKKIVDLLQVSNSRFGIKVLDTPSHMVHKDDVLTNIIVKLSSESFVHFCIIHDKEEQINNRDHFSTNTIATQASIARNIEDMQKYINQTHTVSNFITLIIPSPLGHGLSLQKPQNPIFPVENMSFCDMEMLLEAEGYPLEEILVMIKQREAYSRMGHVVFDISSLLNTYSYWKERDYSFLDSRIPYDAQSIESISCGEVRTFRQYQRVSKDKHSKGTLNKGFVEVSRMSDSSLFEHERELPVYACFGAFPNAFSSCFDIGATTVWILFDFSQSDAECVSTIHDLWTEITRIVYEWLAHQRFEFDADCLELRACFNLHDIKNIELNSQRQKLNFGKKIEDKRAQIKIDNKIMPHFNGADNAGEMAIIKEIICLICELKGVEMTNEDICKNIDTSICSNAKIIHMLPANNLVDSLVCSNQYKEFNLLQATVSEAEQSLFRWRKPILNPELLDKKSSTEVLAQAVTSLAATISHDVQQYNRSMLLEYLFQVNESLITTKWRWRTTAHAVMGLHGNNAAIAAATERESHRARAALAVRGLIEAAVCLCPESGGHAPDELAVDYLTSRMAALIDMGRISDAIYGNLAEHGITLHPDGTYTYDYLDLKNIFDSYRADVFRVDFSYAANAYEKYLTNTSDHETSKHDPIQHAFEDVFLSEFLLTFDKFNMVVAELFTIAWKNFSVVNTVKKSYILKSLDGKISVSDFENFLGSFSLESRDIIWCEGAAFKETAPWRFGRRQSLVFKPIVNISDAEILFGVGVLDDSIKHLLGCFFDGYLDQEFLNSSKAKKFVGSVTNRLGNEFNRTVADSLRSRGWVANPEVSMSILGASKEPNLGDIDVFAYNHSEHVLLVAECKRLKPSKTPSEISSVCKKFQGEANDRLSKHLRRRDWIVAHTDEVRKYFKIDSKINFKILSPLICSAIVPFMYLESSPFPVNQIVAFDNINAYLDSNRGD